MQRSQRRLTILSVVVTGVLIMSLAILASAEPGALLGAYLPVVINPVDVPPPLPSVTASATPSPGATPTASLTPGSSATTTATATPDPSGTPASLTPTAVPGATPPNFNACAFRTGNNATVGVTADVTVTGGLTLAPGDQIAIFSADGSLCAGVEPWSGENIAIAAWGDDPQTQDIDGLQSGEEMAFRIWDKSESLLFAAVATYSLGNGFFQPDGIYKVSSFSVSLP